MTSCSKETAVLGDNPKNHLSFSDLEVGQTSSYIPFIGIKSQFSTFPYFEYMWGQDSISLVVLSKTDELNFIIAETNINPSLLSNIDLSAHIDTEDEYVVLLEAKYNASKGRITIKPLVSGKRTLLFPSTAGQLNFERPRNFGVSIMGATLVDFTQWGNEGVFVENLTINFNNEGNDSNEYPVLDITSGFDELDGEQLRYAVFYEKSRGVARTAYYYGENHESAAYFGFDLF